MFTFAEFFKAITAATFVLATLAWLAKILASEYLKYSLAKEIEQLRKELTIEIERVKAELNKGNERLKAELSLMNERELQDLRSKQENAISKINAESNEQLEHVRATLTRVERLEADLYEHRGESYGEIWTLTGALNLFGLREQVDLAGLTESLKNWYFKHGWVLTEHSKNHYFLVQEALSVGILRSLTPIRPRDSVLFDNGQLRPVQVLRGLRQDLCAVSDRGDEGSYSLEDVTESVKLWKADPGPKEPYSAEERAWVLLQFVLSTFRTRLTQELGSRKPVR